MASVPRRQSPPRFSPRLEILEDRLCLSCTTTLVGSTLTIQATQHGNTINMTDDGSGTITVTCDTGAPASFGGVTNIVVSGGTGKDAVTYALTGTRSSNLQLDVTLTGGNDQFNANLSGGGLSAGTLTFNVDGGGVANNLILNAQNVNIASGAALQVTFNGAKGHDTIGANYSGVLNGSLAFKAIGGGGGDNLSADLTANSGSTGSLQARVEDDAGNDNLALLVNDNSNFGGPSTLTTLDAVLVLGHHDTWTASPLVTVI
jgi:hypothetical protein